MPNSHHLNASWAHDCRIGVGFGYAHFSPEDGGAREMWELSYLEMGIHPNSTEYRLPSIVDLTVRTDGVLPTGSGSVGEDGLTTLNTMQIGEPICGCISMKTKVPTKRAPAIHMEMPQIRQSGLGYAVRYHESA